MAARGDKLITPEWTSRQLRQRLSQVLSPAVCQQVLLALKQSHTDFSAIAKLLQGDPFMAAKVVGLANLVRGRHGDAVVSLDRAVQLIGMRHVQTLVLSVLLTGPLMNLDEPVKRRQDLWRWILACAVAGDWLARDPGNAPRGATAAFKEGGVEHLIYGLVLGLGPLICYAGLGRTYARLLGLPLRPMDLTTREFEELGVTRHRVTGWVLDAINCPAEIGVYARALDRENDTPDYLRARAVEVLGARIAGFESSRATAWLLDALPRLGIDANVLLDDNLPPLRQRLQELAGVFDLPLGDWCQQEPQRHQLLMEAGLSMEAMLIDQLTLAESMGADLQRQAAESIATEAAARASEYDPLTGLLNRRGWEQCLSQEDRLATSQTMGLLVLDVDRFKSLNDTCGHAAGDEGLRYVARAMQQVGTAPLLSARLGGDEFVAIYPVPSVERLGEIAREIAAVLCRSHPSLNGHKLTASMGGVVCRALDIPAQWPRLFAQADGCLYRAKQQGRDRAIIEAAGV